MKKYYVLACCEVMEIGQPVSEWEYANNIILPTETEAGCWRIVSEDYYLDEKGNRKGKTRIEHLSKNKELTGHFETVKEAFEDLNELYKAYNQMFK